MPRGSVTVDPVGKAAGEDRLTYACNPFAVNARSYIAPPHPCRSGQNREEARSHSLST